MAKKARPRYPNKVRVRRRYLSQALLLLAVAGGIWFYYFIQSDPEFGSTLYRLGESLGESRKKIFSNNPENSPGSAQPRPSQSLQSPLKNPDAQTTPDGSRVKGEISRATIPAPPSSSRAAAAAAAKARKRTEQPVSSFSAPVKRATVPVYTTPAQSAVRENKPGSGASSPGSGTNG